MKAKTLIAWCSWHPNYGYNLLTIAKTRWSANCNAELMCSTKTYRESKIIQVKITKEKRSKEHDNNNK